MLEVYVVVEEYPVANKGITCGNKGISHGRQRSRLWHLAGRGLLSRTAVVCIFGLPRADDKQRGVRQTGDVENRPVWGDVNWESRHNSSI